MTTSEINFERRREAKPYSHEDRMKKFVESLHREMMSEVELLFLISEKVKKLRHSPSNCKMGLMFLQNNLIDEAIKHFELAIKNDPNYLEAYNNLGLTYIQIGESKKALQIFRLAIEKGNQLPFYNSFFLNTLRNEPHFDEFHPLHLYLEFFQPQV